MKLGTIVELLSGVPLFSGLSTKQLANISLCGELVVFAEGEEIVEEGSEGDAGFLIMSGNIKRTAGLYAEEDDALFGVGTFVGDLPMLVESEYSSTVSAETNVQALKFKRDSLRQVMLTDASVAEHFRERVSERFMTFVDALKEFRVELGVPDGAFSNNGGSDSDAHEIRVM